MNNYAAMGGMGESTHPADMSEQQWGIVIRDNALLCGHSIVTGEVNTDGSASTVAVSIERAEYPAFVLKPREFQPYDLGIADTGDGVVQSYRIPRFQVDDDAYVKQIETKTSLQLSMAESSFSATDVEAAVGGGAFGASIGAKAGVKLSNSQGSAKDMTTDKENLTMTYNFPRVRMTFDSDSLDLSNECKKDLENISDINQIDRFVKKYGTFYSRRVQLGGRLYCSNAKESSGQASETERTAAFKAAASASFSSAFATGSASASYEQGGASKASEKAADLNISIEWQAQGGDTLLSNNPPMWCPTVASFYNWRVVKQDDVQPLINVIGQIPGYEDIPEKVRNILEAEQTKQPPVDFTGPGVYSLIDRNSQKAIDLSAGKRDDGTKIQIYEWQSGNLNQYWYLSDAGNGQYHILSGQTGAYLTFGGN
ncbi:conserved hypothetical protein [Talaromyces stipitatus ATCC 10500]|uniref:MACPF domain-containing protein n=1 Tax=Talaromyces stipitatus (strain ATCC 10500 / CBS 375.48 / QM 6759 / NRRL 1006) TaxID=441959 RepID=B8LZ71_TALSN|nr:uncharacterized protein TSTA_083470 [Talaromyces stipitatus ATCC 10500]EED21115.1 conserved hypothetical protein [Talaromyces stipitatus ATCC 10500]